MATFVYYDSWNPDSMLAMTIVMRSLKGDGVECVAVGLNGAGKTWRPKFKKERSVIVVGWDDGRFVGDNVVMLLSTPTTSIAAAAWAWTGGEGTPWPVRVMNSWRSESACSMLVGPLLHAMGEGWSYDRWCVVLEMPLSMNVREATLVAKANYEGMIKSMLWTTARQFGRLYRDGREDIVLNVGAVDPLALLPKRMLEGSVRALKNDDSRDDVPIPVAAMFVEERKGRVRALLWSDDAAVLTGLHMLTSSCGTMFVTSDEWAKAWNPLTMRGRVLDK